MATTKAVEFTPSVGHNIGMAIGNVISSEPSVVTGYLAARDPVLIEARKESNIAVRKQLTAQLLANLPK